MELDSSLDVAFASMPCGGPLVGLLRLAQATTDFSMHEPKPDALCSIGHGNPFVEVSI